jgi:hypothetical protein
MEISWVRMSQYRSGQPVHPVGFLVRNGITHILGILHCAAWAPSHLTMFSLDILLLFRRVDVITHLCT